MPDFSKLSGLVSKPEQARIAFGVIAMAALIIGVWQIRSTLDLTLAFPELTEEEQGQAVTVNEEQAKLQQQDTDGDGLSDYDEQYLYRTSAYLKDTDSDGYGDKTEIESGNDPLCPAGTECLRQAPVQGGVITEDEPAGPTANDIRALLRQQGATEEQLSQYDDASLLLLYQEVTGEPQDSSGSSQGSSDAALTTEQKQLIIQMSGAELREFLIQGGADSQTLSQFDDDTLKTIVKQSLGL